MKTILYQSPQNKITKITLLEPIDIFGIESEVYIEFYERLNSTIQPEDMSNNKIAVIGESDFFVCDNDERLNELIKFFSKYHTSSSFNEFIGKLTIDY